MIHIVAAVSENNAIGKDNKLLWHLPNDLKYFKQLTTGHPVIMGRKTFESIGKPLPNRYNIVITRNKPENNLHENVTYCPSLNEAINTARKKDENIYIIGGGEIYRQALPITDTLYITKVHTQMAGDTFFPEINTEQWQLVSKETYFKDEKHAFDYSFLIYRKIPT